MFILSCERSGSTMLRYILDTHSKIVCPGHLYLGSVCESLNCVHLSTIAQINENFDSKDKKLFALKEAKDVITKILDQYMDAKGKQAWCEKTPLNLAYLSLLESIFPEAQYICLYRHCMDVVNSSVNMSKYAFLPEYIPYIHRNPGNIVVAMVENWANKTERLLKFEKIIINFVLVLSMNR
ncbi:sulfotransferase [Methylomonas sp. UP202]|uniref:sulfotransferase family protein n=1 Tax=Methylomonas sp. UP202 TaxID=3040943 RepID=UPI00247B05D2|nr:sulfotransferase [Methylomonas sp. UP202]WGS87248.1 sulfotransferase [Methylomonas sp. UP202]